MNFQESIFDMLDIDNYDTFCELDELLCEILSSEDDWDMSIIIPQIELIKDAMFDGLWVNIES